MKTVDALIAARDFFATNPHRWTHGILVAASHKDGKSCFCALGGISKVTGCLTEKGYSVAGVTVGYTQGPISYMGEPIGWLSRRILKEAESKGIALAAAYKATEYLGQACIQLFGAEALGTGVRQSVLVVNDSCNGYARIMEAFERAIKNAKRRHILGDRKKAVTQAVAQ